MLTKNEIELSKKILYLMKKYKDNLNTKPNLNDELDINIKLIMNDIIPIEQFGKYGDEKNE